MAESAVKVTLKDAAGQLYTVDAAEADQARALGLKDASLGESIEAGKREAAGSGLSGLAAAAAGGLRGASAGLSDPLLAAGAGEGGAEGLAAIKEANPGISAASELAGMVVSPVNKVGAAVMGATKGLSLGTSLLGRAATSAVRVAGAAAAENAIFEAGNQLSEDVLGGHEVTAQKLIAAGGRGLLTGGLIGGVLGAAAPLARGAVKGLAEIASEKAGGFLEGAGVSDILKAQAERQAVKGAGAMVADLKKLGTSAEAIDARVRKVGRTLLDEGLVKATSTAEDIGAAAAARRAEVGERLGGMVRKLDSAAAKPDVSAIANRVRAEVIAPLETMPGREGDAARVADWLKSFETKAAKPGESPSFERLWDVRKDLDKGLKWGSGGQPARYIEEMRGVRDILETELTQAGDRAAAELGAKFSDEYKAAKSLYSDLKVIDDITKRKAAHNVSNRVISLTDTIAGGAGGGIGAMLGGGLGGLAGTAISTAFNKGVREYGNQAAAVLLDKASRLEAFQKATRSVDSLVDTAARSLAEGSPYRSPPRLPQSTEALQKSVSAVRDMATTPQAVQAKAQAAMGDAGSVAPRVAVAMAQTAAKAIAYLNDKAPQGRGVGPSLQPLLDKPRYTATELHEWGERLSGVQDPLSVLDDMAAGNLSRAKIDAVKNVYPDLWEEIRSKLAMKVAERREPISWEQQKTFAIVFGVPTSPSLDPAFVKAMQGTKESPQANDAQADAKRGTSASRPGSVSAPLKSPPSTSLPLERYRQ